VETGERDREANMWAFTRAALELLAACIESAPRSTAPGGGARP
jgi:hypothetical protein